MIKKGVVTFILLSLLSLHGNLPGLEMTNHKKNATFNKFDINRVYKSITTAETGSLKDPWIRTKYKPKKSISTAYGPAQITGTTAADFLSRYPEDFKPLESFVVPFMSQQQGFRTEPDPNHPQFGYGGTGSLPVEFRPMYEQFAKTMMSKMLEEKGGNLNKFIRRYRGVSKKKDKRYYDTFYGAYNASSS